MALGFYKKYGLTIIAFVCSCGPATGVNSFTNDSKFFEAETLGMDTFIVGNYTGKKGTTHLDESHRLVLPSITFPLSKERLFAIAKAACDKNVAKINGYGLTLDRKSSQGYAVWFANGEYFILTIFLPIQNDGSKSVGFIGCQYSSVGSTL